MLEQGSLHFTAFSRLFSRFILRSPRFAHHRQIFIFSPSFFFLFFSSCRTYVCPSLSATRARTGLSFTIQWHGNVGPSDERRILMRVFTRVDVYFCPYFQRSVFSNEPVTIFVLVHTCVGCITARKRVCPPNQAVPDAILYVPLYCLAQ